jgi:hypothetical protein
LKTPNGYFRVDAVRQAGMPYASAAEIPGIWSTAATGFIFLAGGGLSNKGSEEGAHGEVNKFLVNIIWGYKFPKSHGTWNSQEDQMICYVSESPEQHSRDPSYVTSKATRLFTSKAARVSSCWIERLKRRVTAEIWTKTALDRTCGFLTVDISGVSDGPEASNEAGTSDEAEALVGRLGLAS